MSQGFEEELLKEASLADKIRSEAQRELDQIQAETSKILAEIKEKEMSDIRQVKSTSELIVAKLHAEKKIELAKIESDGRKQSHLLIHYSLFQCLNFESQMHLPTRFV